MPGTLQTESPDPQPPASRLPQFFLIAAMLAAGSLGFYFWSSTGKPRSAANSQTHLPFGSVEQAYAPQIQFENLALSRSENFIHQEVTTLSGELINAGTAPLQDVELTVIFFDDLHQVVLREARSLFGAGAALLPPGRRREFEVSFEHIPASWNRQQPAVNVSGIQFASAHNQPSSYVSHL